MSKVEPELEQLRVLRRTRPPKGFPLDQLIADFRRALHDRLDLTRKAAGLEELAGVAHGSDLLAVPRVYRQFTTTRVRI